MNNVIPPLPNISHLDDTGWGLVREWLTRLGDFINNNPPVALGGSQGLIGFNVVANPNTQMQFTASTLLLRSKTGAAQFWTLSTGTYAVCDITVAGPAVGGRDQAAAFTANAWIHFYAIFNPQSNLIGVIASLSAEDVGPTLPAGYSHFCYLGAVGTNASVQLWKVHMAGTLYTYDDPTATSILNTGVATTPTAASAALFVPPNATSTIYTLSMQLSNAAAGAFAAYFRPTGQSVMYQLVDAYIQTAGATNSGIATVELAPGTGRSLDYNINAVPTSGGVYAVVAGYRVPNAAS